MVGKSYASIDGVQVEVPSYARTGSRSNYEDWERRAGQEIADARAAAKHAEAMQEEELRAKRSRKEEYAAAVRRESSRADEEAFRPFRRHAKQLGKLGIAMEEEVEKDDDGRIYKRKVTISAHPDPFDYMRRNRAGPFLYNGFYSESPLSYSKTFACDRDGLARFRDEVKAIKHWHNVVSDHTKRVGELDREIANEWRQALQPYVERLEAMGLDVTIQRELSEENYMQGAIGWEVAIGSFAPLETTGRVDWGGVKYPCNLPGLTDIIRLVPRLEKFYYPLAEEFARCAGNADTKPAFMYSSDVEQDEGWYISPTGIRSNPYKGAVLAPQ